MEDNKTGEQADHQGSRNLYTIEEDVAICKFLHARTHDPTDGLLEKFRMCPSGKKFWEEYIKETGSKRTGVSLASRYQKLMKTLHKIPISVEEKLDLYYSMSHPIPEEFMKEARRSAHLAVDEDRNIEAFEMKTEVEPIEIEVTEEKKKKRKYTKVEKNKEKDVQKETSLVDDKQAEKEEETGSPKAKRTVKRFTDQEEVGMLKFVYEKMCDPETGIVRNNAKFSSTAPKLWTEYAGRQEQPRTTTAYSIHIRKLTKKLYAMPIELRMTVGLYYGLRQPVEPEFLGFLKQKTEIQVDENKRIVAYDPETLNQ